MSRPKPRSKRTPINQKDKKVFGLYIIAIIIIILVLANTEPSISMETQQELLVSQLIVNEPSEKLPAIVVGRELQAKKVQTLASQDYQDVKNEVGVDVDFVVHFEDENGNVINVVDRPCIGSTYGKVNGQTCH